MNCVFALTLCKHDLRKGGVYHVLIFVVYLVLLNVFFLLCMFVYC